MSWVRFDDQTAFNAKVIAAGNEAVGAWLRMTCWTSANLKDGKVTKAVAMLIAGERPHVIPRLLDAGLLERDGDDYFIHDYLKHNPSAEQVVARRKADIERKYGKNSIQSDSDQNPNGIQSESNYPVPSRSRKKETEIPAAPGERLNFDAIYAAYPRHEGRKKGLQRFKAQITTREKYDALAQAVANYAAKIKREKIEEPFIKHFDTFMNCWEDYMSKKPTNPELPLGDSSGRPLTALERAQAADRAAGFDE